MSIYQIGVQMNCIEKMAYRDVLREAKELVEIGEPKKALALLEMFRSDFPVPHKLQEAINKIETEIYGHQRQPGESTFENQHIDWPSV